MTTYNNIDRVCSNAVKMHKKHPKTFEVPKLEEILESEYVKIAVSGERFWVKVTANDGKTIMGKVDNILMWAPFKLGDKVSFKPNKVYQIAE